MAKKAQSEAVKWLPYPDYERFSPAARQVLERFRQESMVHAYLITGPKGVGKLTLAKLLACTLLCTAEQKPCLHCDTCTRVLEDGHPDVLTVFPEKEKEKEKSIGVEPIRELVKSLSRYSVSGGWRVAIIEPVDKMTIPAQNILLKTLEEPLPGIVFLLLAHEAGAALGTIASRCSRVKLLPRSDEVLEDTLAHCGFEPNKVRSVLKLCSGNIGTAVQLLTRAGEDPLPELNRLICSSSTEESLAILNEMKDSRDVAQLFLSRLEDAIHRCLLTASGCGSEELVSDLPAPWRKAATEADYASFDRLFRACRLTRERLQSQVNWQSNLDMLVMNITEEVQKWKRS